MSLERIKRSILKRIVEKDGKWVVKTTHIKNTFDPIERKYDKTIEGIEYLPLETFSKRCPPLKEVQTEFLELRSAYDAELLPIFAYFHFSPVKVKLVGKKTRNLFLSQDDRTMRIIVNDLEHGTSELLSWTDTITGNRDLDYIEVKVPKKGRKINEVMAKSLIEKGITVIQRMAGQLVVRV